MNFMKNRGNHFNQDNLIEYFYGESSNSKEIEDHLRVCQNCHESYLYLKKDIESISNNFKHDFWHKQQKSIMSEISQVQETKTALWGHWLKPAFVTIVIIILFIGVYMKLNYTTLKYTDNDRFEEILLENVTQLTDQPLTSSLDYLDFQEEDTQDTEFTDSLDDLEIFGYWTDLDA